MASRKGIKNNRTLYREYQEAIRNFDGSQFIGESLAVMGKAMMFFVSRAEAAIKAGDEDRARVFFNDALNAGEKLAPFRYAKLASVYVGVEREDTLGRGTQTEKEVVAELIAEIIKAEALPRQIRAYIESGGTVNGVNNSAPNSAKPGGGIGNRDGGAATAR